MNIESIKVGYLVKLRNDLEVRDLFGNCFVNQKIYDNRGNVLRVKKIDGTLFNVFDFPDTTWLCADMVETIIGEKVNCHKCGKELDSENAKFDCLGHAYCDDCKNEVFTVCSECGKELDKNSSDYCEFDGKVYCKECFGKKFARCKVCGEYHLKNKMYKVHDGYICKKCFSENDYVKCDGCGEYHLKSELTDIAGLKLCRNCLKEKVQNTVKSYHYYGDDYWTIHNSTSDGIYKSIPIGFELEIERKDSASSDVTNDLAAYLAIQKSDNLVVCENDGSLTSGFEIISHPMTLGYLNTKGSSKIKDMFELLKELKYTGNRSTSGLHLHVSRESLESPNRSQTEVIDNIALILETFKEEIQTFARRKENVYCNFLTRDNGESITMSYVKKVKQVNRGNRYLVLNERNSKTIEFRIFKSTLDFDTFMATYELVNNIVNIAKFKDIDGLKWSDIIDYRQSSSSYIQKYNASLNINSTTRITVLSNFEKNRKQFTLKKFLNGDFAIDLNNQGRMEEYILMGILLKTDLTVHQAYQNLRECLNRKYDECDKILVRKFNGKRRLISFSSEYKCDDVVSLNEIITLWCEYRELLA